MEFKDIYNQNFRRIFAYVRAKTGNRVLAEDLCSAVWHKAFAKLQQYNKEAGSIEQWLFGIAKNEIKLHYRVNYLKLFIPFDLMEYIFTDYSRPDTDYEESLEKQELFKALNKLTANEREVLTLKYYSQLNNREIAALTNLSESNVGTIAMRARQKMHEFLGESYEE